MLEALGGVAWGNLKHAYGSAADVPDQLRALASNVESERRAALHKLYGNIYHQGSRYPASAPAIPFLFELVLTPAVPNRSGLLQLITRLVAGDWSVRNGQTLHDGERGLFFGRPVTASQAASAETRVLYDCYAAALPYVPGALQLVSGDDPSLRLAAAWFLGCFRPLAGEIAPRLLAQFGADKYVDVRAVLLFSTQQMHGPVFDAVSALQALLPGLDAVDGAVAALCITLAAGSGTNGDVLARLRRGLALCHRDRDAFGFYVNCPFGEGFAGDVGHAVGRLEHQQAKAFLPGLVDTLAAPVEAIATIGLTNGTLRAGFAQPFTGPALSDRERAALTGLLFCDDIWRVANNAPVFAAFGLPTSRKAVGELLQLEPADKAKGRAVFDAAIELATRSGTGAALEQFEESRRLWPQQALTWANAADALRARGDLAEAQALCRRGIDVFGEHQQLHTALLLAQIFAGQVAEAFATASQWLEHHPDDASMLFNRACVGARLGQLDSAMSDLTRAVRLDPRWYQDMASDSDLEPLRERADFVALAASAPEARQGGS